MTLALPARSAKSLPVRQPRPAAPAAPAPPTPSMRATSGASAASQLPQWVPALPEDALVPGQAVRAWANGVRIVVGRAPDALREARMSGEAAEQGSVAQADSPGEAYGGTYFAVIDECPHLELPLAAFGPVPLKRGRLVCPWHLWEFDVHSGRCEYASLYADDEMFFFQLEGKEQPAGEAAGRLRRLPVRIDAGTVEVDVSTCQTQE